MAFDKSNFGAAGTSVSRNPAFHSYVTDDNRATVVTSGYFNDIGGLHSGAELESNDLIFVVGGDGAYFFVVDSITDGVVAGTATLIFGTEAALSDIPEAPEP